VGWWTGDVAAAIDPWERSDGVISIRPPRPGESALLLAGRDEEWLRWMGPGADDPQPTACILIGGTVVGWVDFEVGQEWLAPGEVNVGYNVFAPHRRRGYASRAVELLVEHLAAGGKHHAVALLIDKQNHASLGVARKAGFELVGERDGSHRFARFLG